MLNADAGVGKPPAYSDLADRQTRRRPGRLPLDGPALSHPGSRRDSLRDSGSSLDLRRRGMRTGRFGDSADRSNCVLQ